MPSRLLGNKARRRIDLATARHLRVGRRIRLGYRSRPAVFEAWIRLQPIREAGG